MLPIHLEYCPSTRAVKLMAGDRVFVITKVLTANYRIDRVCVNRWTNLYDPTKYAHYTFKVKSLKSSKL